MKFIHVADLHIGKRVNEFDLIEDQRFVLEQVVTFAREESVDAVVVAGDFFDKPLPSLEALHLAEKFLGRLSEAHIPAIVIPGNHDSAERLSFGANFHTNSLVHIASSFSETPQFIDLTDEAGLTVRFHLLPFIKPINVKIAYPEAAEEIGSYNDAVAFALTKQPLLKQAANVLVAHQFVVNQGEAPETCDSESLSIGGVDSVEASLFNDFDYVALGHIHERQKILRPEVRYSGTPFPYSFSEANHKKSATLVEISAPGSVEISEKPIALLHAFRLIEGSFDELKNDVPKDSSRLDYLQVTLTDRHLMNAMQKLRALYPNIMKLVIDADSESQSTTKQIRQTSHKSAEELFDDFFRTQSGHELDEEQVAMIEQALEKINEQ